MIPFLTISVSKRSTRSNAPAAAADTSVPIIILMCDGVIIVGRGGGAAAGVWVVSKYRGIANVIAAIFLILVSIE